MTQDLAVGAAGATAMVCRPRLLPAPADWLRQAAQVHSRRGRGRGLRRPSDAGRRAATFITLVASACSCSRAGGSRDCSAQSVSAARVARLHQTRSDKTRGGVALLRLPTTGRESIVEWALVQAEALELHPFPEISMIFFSFLFSLIPSWIGIVAGSGPTHFYPLTGALGRRGGVSLPASWTPLATANPPALRAISGTSEARDPTCDSQLTTEMCPNHAVAVVLASFYCGHSGIYHKGLILEGCPEIARPAHTINPCAPSRLGLGNYSRLLPNIRLPDAPSMPVPRPTPHLIAHEAAKSSRIGHVQLLIQRIIFGHMVQPAVVLWKHLLPALTQFSV